MQNGSARGPEQSERTVLGMHDVLASLDRERVKENGRDHEGSAAKDRRKTTAVPGEAHSEADRQIEGGSLSEAQRPVHQGNNQGDWDPQKDHMEVPQGRQSPDEQFSAASGDVDSIAACYRGKLDSWTFVLVFHSRPPRQP